MLYFDIETNGLYADVTEIYVLVCYDTKTDTRYIKRGHEEIEAFVRSNFSNEFDRPSLYCGQNVIGYDIAVLEKVFPKFKAHQHAVDTLVLSRLLFPDMFESDAKLSAAGQLPKKLTNSHSLEAWGYRLGEHKGEFKGPWRRELVPVEEQAAWLQEMEDYCVQDVEVTRKLHAMLTAIEYSQEAIDLEHAVQWIIQRQVRYGVLFNVTAAQNLYADLLIIKDRLTLALVAAFGSWEENDGKPFVPKRTSAKLGYTEGVPVQKKKMVTFNPGSRQHIAKCLTRLYGWKPASVTETGLPEINEKILKELVKFEHVDKLLEYFIVDKRLSQILDGEAGWLKKVTPEGRIHGAVNTNGAVTGRMTHSSPNLAQVPKVGSPYGAECRALFMVPEGKTLVGVDASGLEGRTLGHYVSRYDEGAYAKVLLEGDIHWENCQALGLVFKGTKREKDEAGEFYKEHKIFRDKAKTWFYAWLYGAGDSKLAVILGCTDKQAKKNREAFLKNASAIGSLQEDVIKAVKAKGTLKGIDGRILKVRSEHSALNTLLQSCGAIVMKKALVILDKELQQKGWKPGVDYEFLLNIHDEFQIETTPERAEYLAEIAIGAIRKAGLHFKMRVPMEGDAAIGQNWAETH